MKSLSLLVTALLLTSGIMAQEHPIKLLEPSRSGGMPLMEALSNRATNRAMDAAKSLTEQQLSDLLWAAWGINRADGRRTAASALNRQEIDLYLIGREAAYRYDALEHALEPVVKGDFRTTVNGQEYTKSGSWILIFVADYLRMTQGDPQGNAVTAGIDAGLIAQNVYLYGASEGLAVVVHSSLNRDDIAKLLKLGVAQHVVLGQTVGIPAR